MPARPSVRCIPIVLLGLASVGGCGSPAPSGTDLGASACTSDSTCGGATPHCQRASGRCVGCTDDTQCPDGRICIGGQCAPGCNLGHGCGDGGVCEADAGMCRSCSTDTDCTGATPRCDVASMQCVPCLPAGDNCDKGKACVQQNGAYSCVAGCKSDDECKGDGGAAQAACCNHQCTDLAADASNCGKCATSCGMGKACCAAACTDETSDLVNCGACGTVCAAANGTPACTAGKCAVASCAAGYADCDKDPANGCEVTTTSDVKNCGACAMVCPMLAHGTPTCQAGACGLSCGGSFKDCNAMAGDGCGIDTASDAKNCGACGTACPPAANGIASCAMGVCAVGMCNAPFADCDKNPANGCEINQSNDPANCNGCGVVCAMVAHGMPGCAMGACGVGTCTAPFKDCNLKPGDGCEVDTGGDVMNCGDCGKVCGNVMNGVPGCVAGMCGVASCTGSFGDCDKNAANGCEANTASDPMNCGGCGNACPMGQQCCSGKCVPPTVVGDGSRTPGTDLFFQYAPVAVAQGFVLANWSAVAGAQSYSIAIGTTPGGKDVADFASVGMSTDASVAGLSVQGAWAGKTTYYASVIVSCSGGVQLPAVSSNGVRIAEASAWDGSIAKLRPPDSAGGYTANWPQNGVSAIYGAHYFESVNIANGTTVYTQGYGKVDGVAENIAPNDARVLKPKDGWQEIQANTILIAGIVTASGRGYGGGGGGGATCSGPAPRGHGGNGGLGGDGGNGDSNGCAGGGSGGGGSPNGNGHVGNCTPGGNGTMAGGGGGGSGQWGCSGASAGGDGAQSVTGGAAGPTSDIGGPAPQSGGSASPGGQGEFGPGGGGGGSQCASACSRGGGGGGGYGGGGGGGNESWAGGGGGGGCGGSGGGNGDDGKFGGGPFGGAGAATANPAPPGQPGGYAAGGANGDMSTDDTLLLGSGGGGGGGSESQAGGGGGGAGGGFIRLIAKDTLTLAASAIVVANGAGGGAGSCDDNDSNRIGGPGGAGAGGGLCFEAKTLAIQAFGNNVSARGGGASLQNGGTIKLIYGVLNGQKPSAAGRVYDAGPNSFKP